MESQLLFGELEASLQTPWFGEISRVPHFLPHDSLVIDERLEGLGLQFKQIAHLSMNPDSEVITVNRLRDYCLSTYCIVWYDDLAKIETTL